jgi:hypothetical protein
MSAWSAFYRRLAAPVDRPAGIQVTHTVAPADVVPSHGAVRRELELIESRLEAESMLPDILRDHVLVDELLERRFTLLPVGVVLRPSAPVAPERAS